jgi:hypothetical protein
MIRRAWSRLPAQTRAHVVVASVGFTVGALFGDLLFGIVEETVGNYVDDLLFGIAGAAVASVGYDVVLLMRRRA